MANQEHTSQPPPDTDMPEAFQGWQECPPGMLCRAAASHRNAFMRGRILKTGALASVLGLLVLSVAFWPTSNASVAHPSYPVSRLTCTEVLEQMDGYLNEGLDSDYARQLREHLDHCPHCKQQYRARAEELGSEQMVLHNQPNAGTRFARLDARHSLGDY